ncbi:MAG: adenylate/guanylate cyclase domain-containing protein [Mariprofundaceae bacterium]|nr:adenylate/guanylate cyclase domain-containing protein [Mariprofundaceae bacterium]
MQSVTHHQSDAGKREHAYEHHLEILTVQGLRITALLVVAMVVLDAIAQYFFDALLFYQLFWIRLISVILSLAVWYICRFRLARRITFALGLLLVCIISADIETAIIYTSGYNSPFQTGLALLIVGAGLLVPFPPRRIVVICILIWAVFLGPLVSGMEHISSHEPGFTSSTLFMMCATLITIASSVMTSRLRRREFFARMQLSEEQEKSERLLLNILPAPIAERLKQGEKTISDSFEDISVLFADIANFTPLADHMRPDELLELLNTLFSAFDTLVEEHGLEKIKTIGDAYMVVAGAPEPVPDHASRMAELALDMLDATDNFNRQTGREISIRIGLHSGPAVAGVIGLQKFSYDLWGDTVNTASRMESNGKPGRIQISEDFRHLLAPSFSIEKRGKVSIKGKGEMNTYFLTGRASTVSSRAP